jgi:hypothetical protein
MLLSPDKGNDRSYPRRVSDAHPWKISLESSRREMAGTGDLGSSRLPGTGRSSQARGLLAIGACLPWSSRATEVLAPHRAAGRARERAAGPRPAGRRRQLSRPRLKPAHRSMSERPAREELGPQPAERDQVGLAKQATSLIGLRSDRQSAAGPTTPILLFIC